jgi:uncharacterized protein YceH (UPF0502 family)
VIKTNCVVRARPKTHPTTLPSNLLAGKVTETQGLLVWKQINSRERTKQKRKREIQKHFFQIQVDSTVMKFRTRVADVAVGNLKFGAQTVLLKTLLAPF